MPKLYCVDLAEAYVTQESVSWRILVEKKRYDFRSPNGCTHEKPSAKGGTGKKTGTNSNTRFPQVSCFEKMGDVLPEVWGRTYNVVLQSTKGMRKWDKKLDSCAAEKGVKKLVSSNCTKILEKESRN